jgi:ribonucleotide reductase beta subunit family protein with ferritin-like domain
MGIFDKRVAFKPFEYPDILKYKDAINHSYWLVSEWNFISDIQDFNTRLNDNQRNVVKNALLAISQIEVSVKKFWSKLGDRFPKSEFDQVGITFGECHIDGTEVLTPNGWVDLKNINIGDDIVQFNSDNTFNITKVLHKTESSYNGNLLKFSKKTTETYVTPNHRMIYFKKNGDICECEADKLVMTNSDNKLPEAGYLISDLSAPKLSFIDRLKIAIQADGNRRFYDSGYGRHPRLGCGMGSEYEVTIKKERKKNRLNWIIENLSEKEVWFTKEDDNTRKGYVRYTIRINNDYDYKNFDWVNLTDKNSEWCEDFVQEVAEWDSHRLPYKKDCKIKFSSTNKSVADKVQMIGVCAGYRTNLITHHDKREPTFNDVYIVSFTSNRLRTTLPPLKKNEFGYKGVVRCVTVPSGMIITRYNNKTFIAGNSEIRHENAYSHLLEVLGLNDDFNVLLNNPVINGRVDYLTKYLKGASDNSNENYTLTLALFSLFIENVSLFSQFLIIKSFNKYLNVLKDVDNVVQATAQEENLHAQLGIIIINQIKKEYPDWFNDEFYDKLYRACKKAYDAEEKIIDWIYGAGEIEFLSKDTVKEFIKYRFNESIQSIGGKSVFEIDDNLINKILWFNEEINADVHTDFFYKRPTTYSKFQQAITAESIF